MEPYAALKKNVKRCFGQDSLMDGNVEGMFDEAQDICTVPKCLPTDCLLVARGEMVNLQ